MSTNVSVVPVNSHRTMNDFISIVHRIYNDCPQYVPDLESDIREFFNIKTNPATTKDGLSNNMPTEL